MDFLKAQLDRIQRQLAGLNATQKMLTAALVAIMVITVVWWAKYAGEAEMVPLLNQSFSATDLGPIEQSLAQNGIHYEQSGDKVLVPAEKRMEALSKLTYARVLPQHTEQGFDEIIKEMSPFDPQSKQEKIFNHGKEMLLSQIIASFPDVTRADVVIDPTSQHRIGDGSVEPSATINIILRDGVRPSDKMVDAAADLVAGAQAGLSKGHIKVVVNGLAQRVRDASDESMPDAPEQLTAVQQNEAWAEKKVRDAFGEVPGLLVSVTMSVSNITSQKETHQYDKDIIQKEIKSSNETDETTSAAPPASEPGTLPNTQVPNAPSASASGESQNHEKTDTQYQLFVPETRTVSKIPWGAPTTLGATVRFPISYFIPIFRQRNPSVKEPTYDQLRPIVDEKLALFRNTVAMCVGLPKVEVDKVAIDTYVDAAPTLAATTVGAAQTSAVSLMIGGHAKEIALGALALMSLFMASMMVRKTAPSVAPAAPSANPQQAPAPVLMANEPLAGEAGSGDPALDGMELNDDAIRAQQMVEQVSTMVRENPDGAAALVKRWLNRT